MYFHDGAVAGGYSSGRGVTMLCLAGALACLTPRAAQGDCNSDVGLQNSIVDQYNSLARGRACESGAQEAVRIGLLEQALAVTGRLESCEAVSGGTTVSELKSILRRLKDGNAQACREIRGFDQLNRDVEAFKDAVEQERKRIQKRTAEIDEQLAEIRRKLAELEAAEKAGEAPSPVSPRAKDLSECARAIKHMNGLASTGNDVSAMRVQLKNLGCEVD